MSAVSAKEIGIGLARAAEQLNNLFMFNNERKRKHLPMRRKKHRKKNENYYERYILYF